MESRKRRMMYAIVAVAAASVFVGIYFSNATAALTEVGRKEVVDFYAQPPEVVAVKKGETQTFAVNIYAPESKAKELTVIVNEPEEIFSMRDKFTEKASEGMTAEPDRKNIEFEAVSAAPDGEELPELKQRDVLNVSITADQSAREGAHTFAITLTDSDERFMTTYFTVNVTE